MLLLACSAVQRRLADNVLSSPTEPLALLNPVTGSSQCHPPQGKIRISN